MLMPAYLKNVTHPLIAASYLKKVENGALGYEDVLVLESRISSEDDDYIELLSDLADIRRQAENEIGTFDRVDIRMC